MAPQGESTWSSSYYGRGLKVRTGCESDLREAHLDFAWVNGSWGRCGRAALSSPGSAGCPAAVLCAGPLPCNSTAPAVCKSLVL